MASTALPPIPHLAGRPEVLALLGWTGAAAEWLALVCLHSGVFTRAQMTGHPAPEQVAQTPSGAEKSALAGSEGLDVGRQGRDQGETPRLPTKLALPGRLSSRPAEASAATQRELLEPALEEAGPRTHQRVIGLRLVMINPPIATNQRARTQVESTLERHTEGEGLPVVRERARELAAASVSANTRRPARVRSAACKTGSMVARWTTPPLAKYLAACLSGVRRRQ